jgi:hypothetical protein
MGGTVRVRPRGGMAAGGPGGLLGRESTRAARPGCGRGAALVLSEGVRRCPTLPQGLPCSTIGAEGLNFRVRDGTGCFPFAMAAVTLWSYAGCPYLQNRTVDARSVVVMLSPRPVSTGQLHALRRFHIRPINPVVCWGPYQVDPVGTLILKRASRLDAFSGYPFQT